VLLEEHEAQQEQDDFNRAQQEMQRHQPQSKSVGIQDGTPMSWDEDSDEMEIMEDGEYREELPNVMVLDDENCDDYEMDNNRAHDYANDDRRDDMDGQDPSHRGMNLLDRLAQKYAGRIDSYGHDYVASEAVSDIAGPTSNFSESKTSQYIPKMLEMKTQTVTSEMFPSTNNSGNLCKFGCGQICNPGFTARGNPFDTCCKSCAISQGSTSWHDVDCRNRNATRTFLSSNTYLYRQQPLIPSGTTPGTPITDDDDEPIFGDEILCPNSTNLCPFDMLPNNTNHGMSSFGGDLGGPALNNMNLLERLAAKYATNSYGHGYMANQNPIPPPKPKSILSLDPWMIALDYESLSKLTTAQLMQRLKSHNLPHRGLKHELIERWRTFKLKENGSEVHAFDSMETD